MKRGLLLVVVICLLLSALPMLAQTRTPVVPLRPTPTAVQPDVPRLIRFSGAIPDATGTTGVTFALYSQQTGGAPL